MDTVVAQKAVKKRVSPKRVILIILAVLVVTTLITFSVIPPLIMHDMIKLHADVEAYSAEEYGVTATPLSLETEDGFSLAAWEVAAEAPKGVVVLVSGIHNPSVTAFFGYAKMLRENGYASVLVEMRAHGDSEGDKICLGMYEYLDVKAGVAYIQEQAAYQGLPVIAWGTSMGAATALNAIGEIPEIDGVISCSAYSSWPDEFCDMMASMGAPAFLVAIQKPFVWGYSGIEYGFDKLKINPLEEIQRLNGRPALLMHSTGDSQVPYANFERLMAKAPDTVETFIRKGDEHFICYERYFDHPAEDTEFSGAVLGFLKKHFG